MEREYLFHGHDTSVDYDLLWELIKKYRVVCYVTVNTLDDGKKIQDICQSKVYNDGEFFEIGVRGIGYISAFNKEEFKQQCSESDLEFIVPTK